MKELATGEKICARLTEELATGKKICRPGEKKWATLTKEVRQGMKEWGTAKNIRDNLLERRAATRPICAGSAADVY